MIDWTHWHNEPYLIGGLVLLGWLFAVLSGPLRPALAPGQSYPKKQAWFFYASLVVFYLAVGSPLDQIGERFLLSAHMIQHMLMIYVSAVLMLLGLPAWMVSPLYRGKYWKPVVRVLTHPMSCAILYTLVLSVWHLAPGLYDLALRVKEVHVLEHLMFFGAALFYWWPILSPVPDLPPLRPAVQMLYLVSVTILMTPLFAFIAFADNILYPTYEYAPRLIDKLSPHEDQLLGAAIMKLGGLTVTGVVLAIAFYRWYQADQKATGTAAVPRTSA